MPSSALAGRESPGLATPAGAAAPDGSLLGRPLVLAALVVLALAGYFAPGTQLGDVVLRLRLPDNDDAMRLVEVRDFLTGQGWFDTVQHRYLPPAGASMHWSRFVDAPIALLIAALGPLFGPRLTDGIVAALWPSLLFLAYVAVVFAATRRSFGLRAACIAVF